MAQHRRYFDDVSYSEAHRYSLRELYGRVGHRLDMADRDWTEFCNYCKKPLAIVETVRDVGQDIADKATTVTRGLANPAGVRAWLVAWRVERPREVQDRIDRLGREIMRLQTEYPIIDFQVRELTPFGPLVTLPSAAWWETVLMIHRDHHATCPRAQRHGRTVDVPKLRVAQQGNPVWTPEQLRLKAAA